jgi:integrase
VFSYEASAARLTGDPVGRVKIAALTVDDLDAAFARLAANGKLTRATLVKTRSVLAQSFDFAMRKRRMTWNPARAVSMPRAARVSKVTRSLDIDQALALIEEATAHRWHALFVLALNLGLRPGELTALYWESIDLDAETISIERGARRTRSGQTYVSDEVKTKRARRTLQLPAPALAALRAHRSAQQADDLVTGVRSPLVFRCANGSMIGIGNLARELADMTDRIGLGRDWSPNELRHTAASLLVDQGVPLVVVADILGHTTTRMLELTYRKNTRPVVTGAATANVFGAASVG